MAVLLISACGDKKTEYDSTRLLELCADYFSDRSMSEDQWEEFAALYSAGTDKSVIMFEEALPKVTPDMTMYDAMSLVRDSGDDFSALIEADGVVFDGLGSGVKPELLAQLYETRSRKRQIEDQFKSDVMAIISPDEATTVKTEAPAEKKEYLIEEFPQFAEEYAQKIRNARDEEEYQILSDYAFREFENYLMACKTVEEEQFVRQNYGPIDSASIEVGEDFYYSDDDTDWE